MAILSGNTEYLYLRFFFPWEDIVLVSRKLLKIELAETILRTAPMSMSDLGKMSQLLQASVLFI